jgi:small conductance mechanosensitive channel
MGSRRMAMGVGFVLALTVSPAITHAQGATPLSEEVVVAIDGSLAELAAAGSEIDSVKSRVATSQGLVKDLLERRLDRAWMDRFAASLDLAESVADAADAGGDVSAYLARAKAVLAPLPKQIRAVLEHQTARVVFSTAEQPAVERVALDARVAATVAELDGVYQALIRSLELARRFELDLTVEEKWLAERVAERAENTSIYLELTVEEVDLLGAQASLLPEDKDIAASLAVAEGRVETISGSLESTIAMMNSLELDSTRYGQQLVGVTGEIKSVDTDVISGLIQRWSQSVRDSIAEGGPRLFLQVALFLVIVLAFLKLAQVGQRLVDRGLSSSRVKLSELLTRMVVSTTRNLIIVVGILIALSQLGVSLGPLLAGLGIAGFVIGFALQDALSNFASGMMILLYRPFDVGDLVEAGTVFGRVDHMSLVNTTILTLDNQTLIVPNNKIWGDVIKNVTAQKIRRVDLVFGISYGDDIPKAEAIMEKVLEEHDRVLDDPEPMVRCFELGDSSVNFVCRPWVESDDYWDVYWDVTRTVKMRFDEEGITIPFPQRDVHFPTAKLAIPAAGGREPTELSAQTEPEPDAAD